MQLNVEGIYAPINVFPKSGSGGIANGELDNFEKLGSLIPHLWANPELCFCQEFELGERGFRVWRKN